MKQLVFAAMLVSSSVMADPYIGIGASRVEGDLKGWESNIFVGYKFSEFLSAEFGINNARLSGKINGPDQEFIDLLGEEGPAMSELHLSGTSQGFSVALLPTLPINDSLDAYMSLGYRYDDLDITASDDFGHQTRNTSTESGFEVGAGLKWNLSDRMFIRGGIKSSNFDDPVTMGVNLGINF